MILEHCGTRPGIDPSARIAPNAVICGDVTIGPDSSVGFGAVITAESGKVTIGEKLRGHGYGRDPWRAQQSRLDRR